MPWIIDSVASLTDDEILAAGEYVAEGDTLHDALKKISGNAEDVFQIRDVDDFVSEFAYQFLVLTGKSLPDIAFGEFVTPKPADIIC